MVAIVLVSILGFGALMAWGMANKEDPTGRSGITRVHEPAPQFTLALFSGQDFALEKHLGQPVIINFWASWCVPCREEAPALESTWQAYKDKGVEFVGVDIQNTEEDARAFIKEFRITYPNGPDVGGKITINYGVVGIPVTFFVDRDGIIARRFVGALSEQQLMAWTEELVTGVPHPGNIKAANPDGYFRFDQPSGR